MKIIKAILLFFNPIESERRRVEKYLSESADHADLERRLRQLERQTFF